jgi:hypothetical protein
MISRHTIRVMLFYKISKEEAVNKVDIQEMQDFEKSVGLCLDPIGRSIFDDGLDQDYIFDSGVEINDVAVSFSDHE